jgi:hypothetical protein
VLSLILSDCWQQCDAKVDPASAGWWYLSGKNKLGVRSRKSKFRKEKELLKLKKAAEKPSPIVPSEEIV